MWAVAFASSYVLGRRHGEDGDAHAFRCGLSAEEAVEALSRAKELVRLERLENG